MQDVSLLQRTTGRLLLALTCGLLLVACGSQPMPQETQSDVTTRQQALGYPGCIPQIETCNGVDDDCDGQIDDGIGRQLCQNATCHTTGYRTCVNGAWSACSARGPKREICNGVDDDCDGTIDEMPPRECYDPASPKCYQNANGQWLCVGECSTGTQTCRNGAWTSCQGAVYPSPEVCDGKDNNCDGVVDNGQLCPANHVCTPQGCKQPCAHNYECPTNYFCGNGYCEHVCSNVVCPIGQSCVNGQCQ